MRFLIATLLLVAGAAHADDATFQLVSPDLPPGQAIAQKQVYNGFGCSGGNVSPALSWRNPPAGTKSFALLMHDPDAPTGSGWWHWVVWNIPANMLALPALAGDPATGLLPPGVMQGNTDFGTPGYGGPCPPPGSGPHHYHFRLHALKVEKLDLPASATAAFVGYNVMANSLGTAELMSTYAR
jgi:hypothetical protein